MAGETTSYEVKCACGAATIVEAAAAGVEQSCASCGASFRVIWALDPATKAKVLRRAAAIRIPPGAFEFSCECGQPLVARREQAGKQVNCPVCRTALKIELYTDPATLETRLRRASSGHETAVVPATAVGKPTARRQAPRGGQDVLCDCGEYLRVYEENLDKRALCPSCGALLKLERFHDPETSVIQVRARIVGKTEPPPKTDPDTWSIEDFA